MIDKSSFKYLVKLGPPNLTTFGEALARLAPKYVSGWCLITGLLLLLFWFTKITQGHHVPFFELLTSLYVLSFLAIAFIFLGVILFQGAKRNAYRWYGFSEKGLFLIDNGSNRHNFISYARVREIRPISDRSLAIYFKGSERSVLRDFTFTIFIYFESPIEMNELEEYLKEQCTHKCPEIIEAHPETPARAEKPK